MTPVRDQPKPVVQSSGVVRCRKLLEGHDEERETGKSDYTELDVDFQGYADYCCNTEVHGG